MPKPLHASKLDIGSSTDAEHGIATRIENYRKGSALPKYVKIAITQGYSIDHIDLLFWTPMPTAGLVPKLRGRILALEACFAFVFHACFANVSFELPICTGRSQPVPTEYTALLVAVALHASEDLRACARHVPRYRTSRHSRLISFLIPHLSSLVCAQRARLPVTASWQQSRCKSIA